MTGAMLKGALPALLVSALFTASAQPYGLTSRPTVGPFLNGVMPEAAPAVSGNWSAVAAFPNLVFTNALGFTAVPGTNRYCVWEREGRVWMFATNSSVTTKTLVLDISNQCQGWDDSGLLNLAFHPGFATNRYLFVYYTWVTPGTVVGSPTTRPSHRVIGKYHDRLSRFTLDANGVAIPGSETVFVDLTGNDTWHNGGGMFFHPGNGFLYWTDGDDVTLANRQVITNSLFSGVFRIDVDQRGGAISHPRVRQPNLGVTANYYIPNDNPWVGQSNVLEEFFALGLRSPHRMTYDAPRGRIYIGDVGESAREEISVIEPGEAGLNFQWNYREGFVGTMPTNYIGISKSPLLEYPRTDGRAVIGGHVYRGSEFAADLGGKYIFGDNVTRSVWVLDETTSPATKIFLCTLPKGDGPNSGADYTGLSSFGLDHKDEIYLCQMSSIGGRIYRLARTNAPTGQPFPLLLSATGTFTNLATLAPAPGLVPYSVNSPLWSDAAHKTRWAAIPTNTFVSYAPTGEWIFPAGSVFVKHFDLATNETAPNQLRRLETRLLVRDTNNYVYGATYKWRVDLSDADLVPSGLTENITITTSTGTRTQQWFYPGRQDCLACHTVAAGGVLGVSARQLNGDFLYSATGVTDNQIRAWNHVGLFSSPVNEGSLSNVTKLVAVDDINASLEHRFRSYLDANCSHCHRPGGNTQAQWDGRIATPLAAAGIINGTLVNNLGDANNRIIKPLTPTNSVLLTRDATRGADSIQMPPLATSIADPQALLMLSNYIMSLSPTFRLTAAPTTQGVSAGGSASFNAIVQFDPGYTNQVTLGVGGTPAATFGYLTPPTISSSTTSVLAIVTSPNAPTGNYPLTVIASDGSVTNTALVTLNLAPYASSLAMEAETLPVVTGGANAAVQVDANNSAGLWLALLADGVGDYIDYTLTNVPAGTHNLKLKYKAHPNRGITSMMLNGVSIDPVLDQYANPPTYPEVDLGNFVFGTPGNHVFRQTVMGRNALAGAFTLSADLFTLTLSTPPSANPPLLEETKFVDGNIVFHAVNGSPGRVLYVLSSTNLTLPLADWTVITTNILDASGNFTFTNTLDGAPARFYRIQLP
jgi:glucose/arabinose dehydrogenase